VVVVADWPGDVVAGVADQDVEDVEAELLAPELDVEVEPELELFAAAVAVAALRAMLVPSPRNAVTLRAAATTRARAAAWRLRGRRAPGGRAGARLDRLRLSMTTSLSDLSKPDAHTVADTEGILRLGSEPNLGGGWESPETRRPARGSQAIPIPASGQAQPPAL